MLNSPKAQINVNLVFTSGRRQDHVVAFGSSGDGSDRIGVTLQDSSKMEAHVSCVVLYRETNNKLHRHDEDKNKRAAKIQPKIFRRNFSEDFINSYVPYPRPVPAVWCIYSLSLALSASRFVATTYF
jgi:hypothetical protein